MRITRTLAISSVFVLMSADWVFGQSLSRYRQHRLGSSLASVVKASGARESDVITVHERPVRIQEVEWRAPYVTQGSPAADPVRTVLFRFYDDRLYSVVVKYERERMDGLTDADVIDSVSAKYGALPMHAITAERVPPGMPRDTTIVARWDDGASVLSLVRTGYDREFQLVLLSKELSALAGKAIEESLALNAREAPQRELDQRTKQIADARVAHEKARTVNKAAFRP